MDAKSKANFINSVASGSSIPCPKCNTLNEAGSLFCAACGTKLTAQEKDKAPEQEDPAMKPLDQVAQEAPETKPVAQAEPAMKPVAQAESAMKPVASAKTETIVVEESRAAFAEGIPAWDLLPPEMVVRRKQR